MSADRPNRSARSTLLAERAHAMRQCPTWSEQVLWERALRRRGLGVEFRRQVVIGDQFIVDFLAPAQKLIVEVDGPYHQSSRVGTRVVRGSSSASATACCGSRLSWCVVIWPRRSRASAQRSSSSGAAKAPPWSVAVRCYLSALTERQTPQ